MIKIEYIIGAALVLFWLKGNKAEDQKSKTESAIPTEGSNWGGTWWDRLSAADLHIDGYPNLHTGPQADPGKIGMYSLGITGGWDGTALVKP